MRRYPSDRVALNDHDDEYFFKSRLPREPLASVDDRHVNPIEPRQLSVSATMHF